MSLASTSNPLAGASNIPITKGIPILGNNLSNKPNINKQLLEVVDKLDMVSSLILMGILLDHSLKLCGLEKSK